MSTSQGRRVYAAGIAAALAILAALPGQSAAQEPPPELLPDLQGQAARDLSVQVGSGVRNLRLTTTVANGGAGAFEVFPASGTDCDGDENPDNDRLAFQRVFRDSNGNGVFDRAMDTATAEYPAGCMIFHIAHAHWHFEDFANYELRIPGTDSVVAAAGKVSFCLLDSNAFNPNLLGYSDDPFYGSCDTDTTEGISVGWSDTYLSGLPGQAIDIRGIPDGEYCLAVQGDPSDIVHESNELNNEGVRPIGLFGNAVAASGASCAVQMAQGGDRSIHAPKCAKPKNKKKRKKPPRRRCRRG